MTHIGRRTFLKYGVLGAAGIAAIGAGGRWVFNRHKTMMELRNTRLLMNTYVAMTVLTDNPEAGRAAINAAFLRMGTVAAQLSRFEADGPVGRLNQNGILDEPPQALLDVLGRARHYAEISGGAFDVTILPVLEYYYGLPKPIDARQLDRQLVAKRDREVDYRALNVTQARIAFDRPGMAITLDGIAKGYVVDQGIEVLRRLGMGDALIDAGGDVRALSRRGARHVWTVAIMDPQNTKRACGLVRLQNGALATSGNYEIFFSTDRRFFHIINPHTGYSPNMYSSVTVLASRSVDADALGVTLYSLPLKRVQEVTRDEGKEYFIVSWDGRHRWRSAHFPLYGGGARVL